MPSTRPAPRHLLPFAALALLSMAAPGVRAAAPTAVLPSPDWTVDHAASRVSLTLSGDGGPVQGSFKRWTAAVAFDPAKPAKGKLEVSIETASLVTGDPARDQALTGAFALAAARAPRLGFVAKTITLRPDGGFDAAGALSLRGSARPATAVLRFAHDPRGRRLDIELALPPDAFAALGRPRPAAAALAVRLAARDR